MKNISEDKDIKKEETKEINLDELYDGSINNTVVIDPVTNDEVLLKNRRPNIILIILFLLIIAVLIIYFINNKTKFGVATKDVAPKTTTTTITTTIANNNEEEKLLSGELTCIYTSNLETESQNVTYKLSFRENKLKVSEFNYIVVSNTDLSSSTTEKLKEEYENFYINNVSNVDSKTTFEKNEKGFSFIVNTNYESEKYFDLITEENKTVLFVKPTKEDNIYGVKEKYELKGFKCSINAAKKE